MLAVPPLGLSFDLGEIRDLVHRIADARQKAQPIYAQLFFRSVNGHAFKKFIDRLPQLGQLGHRLLELLPIEEVLSTASDLWKVPTQRPFRVLHQLVRVKLLPKLKIIFAFLDRYDIPRTTIGDQKVAAVVRAEKAPKGVHL